MLIKLFLDAKGLVTKSLHRDEPPEDVSISKHARQFVEVCLLLKLDQLFVLQLHREIELDDKVIFPLL